MCSYQIRKRLYLICSGAPFPESGKCAVLCELPISSPDFFGRNSELGVIRDHLDPTSPEQKGIVLCGLGGFGKTRLALQYIELYRKEFTTLLWIDASTLDAAKDSFSQAASEISRLSTGALPQIGSGNHIDFMKDWLAEETNKSALGH